MWYWSSGQFLRVDAVKLRCREAQIYLLSRYGEQREVRQEDGQAR
jgi:hypothetical protein